jgi:hypothetical protein
MYSEEATGLLKVCRGLWRKRKQKAKKRAKNYDSTLPIGGTLDDLLKVAIKQSKK